MRVKQAVIMAGGVGRRLRPLTENVPKCLLKVGDKPFIEYVLAHLVAQGIKEVVLCVSYKYEKVVERLGHEHAGMKIVYSVEAEPLGTAWALALAAPYLGSYFFLINADTYIPLSYSAVEDFYFEHAGNKIGRVFSVVVVHYSHEGRRENNVWLLGHRVVAMQKTSIGLECVKRSVRARLIAGTDAGLSLHSCKILKIIERNIAREEERYDKSVPELSIEYCLYRQQILEGALLGYVTSLPFYHISDHEGLEYARRVLVQNLQR